MHFLSTLTFQRIYLFQLNSNHKVFTGHTSKLLYTQELPKPIVKKATMFTCQMTNDQFFVHLALTDMINNAKATDHSYTVIESNNYKVQYKSSAHFWSIQELADKYAVPIIRVFSIAEHSSCELFSQNLLEVEQLKKMNLRSAFANRRIPWRRC